MSFLLYSERPPRISDVLFNQISERVQIGIPGLFSPNYSIEIPTQKLRRAEAGIRLTQE